MVVATAAEPAVVEDEALDADARRRVGERLELVQVVVEVDGLPRVEDERARGRWLCVRGAALAAVQPARDAVEAVGRVHEDHVGRRVGLARREAHLAGLEQLAAAEDGAVHARRPRAAARRGARGCRSTRRGPTRPRRCGSRSRRVPAHEQQGRVVAGAAAPGGTQVGAVLQGRALRRPLAAPAAGEVEHLGGPRRQRQHGAQGAEVEGHRLAAPSLVTDGATPQDAVLVEGMPQAHLEPHAVAGGGDQRSRRRPPHHGDVPAWRGRAAAPGARHTRACPASRRRRWAAR